jgi:cell division protein FtsL
VKAKSAGSWRKKILIGGLVFLLVVLFITSLFGKKGLIEIYRARKNQAALQKEIEQLKQEKSRLEREITELEKNPKAVERTARGDLGLVSPDERVLVKKKK